MCFLLPWVELWCKCWERCRVEKPVVKCICGSSLPAVEEVECAFRSNDTQESENGVQKTHYWCYPLLLLWEYALTSRVSSSSPVSRLSIALCLQKRKACALHDCKLLFAWLLTTVVKKNLKLFLFFSFFFKGRSCMALVLVIFLAWAPQSQHYYLQRNSDIVTHLSFILAWILVSQYRQCDLDDSRGLLNWHSVFKTFEITAPLCRWLIT